MKEIILNTLFCISSICYSQELSKWIILPTENNIIYDICYTDNGGALAIADNSTIKVYSTNTYKLLNEFKPGHIKQILAIDISKDSTLLVSGGKDSTIVIWDFTSNKILQSLTYQKGIITSLQISPDCRYLVSGGSDNKVYLYDLEKNEVIHEFVDHTNDITSVRFSPDGKLIASASGDKLINMYNIESGKLITSLKGHKNWVRHVSFSTDGTKLISCGDDSRIIIWNISDMYNARILTRSKYSSDWILSVDFFKDNNTYVLGGAKGIAVIIGNFGCYKTKIGKPITKVLFKPDNENYMKIAIATYGSGVKLIDAANMIFKNN